MKRKISTGLKTDKKTIFIGDVLRIEPTEHAQDNFKEHTIGKILSTTGYKAIYIQVKKHKWLELDMNVFVEGKNGILAEMELVRHVAQGLNIDDFDKEYKEHAPVIFSEPLLETTMLRFLIECDGLNITKVDDFDKVLSKSEEFYANATREIHLINVQREIENGTTNEV